MHLAKVKSGLPVSLRNNQKSARELQNLDLSRPSDKERERNVAQTAKQLGVLVKAKNEPAFLSAQAQKKQEKDQFLRYTPVAVTAGQKGQL